MFCQLSIAGAASETLARQVHEWWLDAAGRADVDVTSFDPDAPVAQRVAWARRDGLSIATIYSRFSSKRQHSTADQVRTCVQFAAHNGMYVPPELVSIDEGVKGQRIRRDGLDRLKAILQDRHADVLLVFKASRLFRHAYQGYQLIQEQVVEEGLRAISVTQGIDTADSKTWKMTLQLHGLMDEMLLEAIGDHVRAGLKGLFGRGYTTGAVPVGYRRKEVDGPLTNRGLPRTVPEVDPEAAELIRQHYRLVRDGMSVRAGWRRWVAEDGPTDPRSPLGHMGYRAYRRMLSNPRYTGRWEFGRKRNQFSSKRDYVRQIEQPESEIEVFQCDELRVVDDELFFAVQERLRALPPGPRGPRKARPVRLHDLTTELFRCACCGERFYKVGPHGRAMQCKRAGLCPSKAHVNRERAVRAVCEKLTELIAANEELICEVACRAEQIDAQGDDELQSEIAVVEAKVRTITNRISDLTDLAGQGTEDDRKELKAKIRSAQSERSGLQVELTRLRNAIEKTAATVTPDDVRRILGELTDMLENAAGGALGDEAVYRAPSVFRQLVGGHIEVHVEPRPARKRELVRGKFRPRLVQAVKAAAGLPHDDPKNDGDEVVVWLRQPPRIDRIASEVRRLYEEEGLGFRGIGQRLGVPCANVHQSYLRYYEMIGQPAPPRRPACGQQRRSA